MSISTRSQELIEQKMPQVQLLDGDPSLMVEPVEVAVIYGGALDEDFYLEREHAVEVATVLAEDCYEHAVEQGGETYDVVVTEFVKCEGCGQHDDDPDDECDGGTEMGSQVFAIRGSVPQESR